MSLNYLEMKNISKAFPGVQALSNVSISINEGEVIGLLGENGAGKSTLMNVLGGLIRKDQGEIVIGGKEVNIRSVADASKEGIAFIHQELSLFGQLTVQENLFIEDLPRKKGGIFIDKKLMRQETNRIMEELGMDIPATSKVSTLTMGQQQIVEIASALLKNAKIIILDEPSTSLTSREREKLYDIVRKLRSEKKLIIYITHDIENALELSDRVYVLRDGKNSGDSKIGDITKEDVIRMMVGSKVGKAFIKSEKAESRETALEIRNLSAKDKVRDVSLRLSKGEVVGMYGLIGSGRTEMVNALYGFNRVIGGEVFIKGEKVDTFSPETMKSRGVGYLTENRRDEGLFLEQGVNQNITITDLPKIQGGLLKTIDAQKDREITQSIIQMLKIATPSEYQLAGKLSGGNQQKIVIGKWLLVNPEIFILDEPTRGIDVGAKNEIYMLIDEIARKGVTILLISSEIEEILGLSDRVLVMSKGSIAAELGKEQITKAEIIKYAMG